MYNASNWREGHTHRLVSQSSQIKIYCIFRYIILSPSKYPTSFCKLPGEFRPKKIVKRALLFSIIPVSTIFCHLCTPFWCVFDAVQYVPERLYMMFQNLHLVCVHC